MTEIGAACIGICKFCKRELYSTTQRCRSRGYSGGHPIPRLPTAPPCPVEDGTLTAAIAALKIPPPAEYPAVVANQGEDQVTKNELIEAIISDTSVSKKDAETILRNLGTALSSTLKGGGDFTLPGAGIFKPKKVPAREGRNPSTGEKIQIAAKTKVAFKPAKSLSDAVA